MESSDYTAFLLTLDIEKFGSPGTMGSFCLSGAPFLRTEVLSFPKCYSWAAVRPLPFPLQKLRFSSRLGHVYVKVMQGEVVTQRSSGVAEPVSDFMWGF